MVKVLITECYQEISSFNPLPSQYENFHIQRGEDVLGQKGEDSAIGGALKIFGERSDVEVIPAYSAQAESAGLLSAEGWRRLATELVESVASRINEADAIFVSMHGAMAADGELDPEGYLLERVRDLAGPEKPIVVSLDLHGILTDRMLRQIDGTAMY